MANITPDRVFAAADALEASGSRVSVRSVRDYLGGGSPNQITPLLASWRARKPSVAAPEIQLDPRIVQLIAEQVRAAAGEAAVRADERANEAEDTLTLCQQENSELAEQLATTLRALDEARAKVEQQAGTISEIREEIERVRSEAEEEVEEANTRANREREVAETAQHALARAELRLESMPRLEGEVERLRTALDEALSGKQSAEQQAAVAAAKLDAATQRVSAAEEREREARQQQAAAQEAAARANGDAHQAQITLQAVQARLESTSRELETARGSLSELKEELKELRAEKKPAKNGEAGLGTLSSALGVIPARRWCRSGSDASAASPIRRPHDRCRGE
jgi:colicin import membrane protein